MHKKDLFPQQLPPHVDLKNTILPGAYKWALLLTICKGMPAFK